MGGLCSAIVLVTAESLGAVFGDLLQRSGALKPSGEELEGLPAGLLETCAAGSRGRRGGVCRGARGARGAGWPLVEAA